MAQGASTTTELPSPIRWSKSLYHQMPGLGWFRNKHVQLIEGEIVEMAPMGSAHWVALNNAYRALAVVFPVDRFTLTMQCPVDVCPNSEPEPDITVIEGLPGDFAAGLPTADRIRLVVEVSETSLAFDRGRKAGVYNSAGFAEYWVLDVANRSLDAYTDPIPAESRYAEIRSLTHSDSVNPQVSSTASVRVADLF
jgi:Uma2 family endonuclease